MLFKIFYTFLQWTWGIVQNLAGLCMFLKYRGCKHYFYNGALVTVWNSKESSMGIGMFVFISENCPKDETITKKETYNRTLVHEYGHTVQSIILGPLFLPVIALPSCMWAFLPKAKQYRANNRVSYFWFYPEKWANQLGEKVTHEKSMGQAIIVF